MALRRTVLILESVSSEESIDSIFLYVCVCVCVCLCMYVYTCYVLIKPPMPIYYVLVAVFASCFYVLIIFASRVRTYLLLRPSCCVCFVFLRPI
jgi:hypothetical protein